MSRENVDVVYEAYEAVRRHDLHAFLDVMHPEVEARSYILEVEGAVYHGRDGMREFMEGIWSVFPDWTVDVLSAQGFDDVVVAEIHGFGRAVESGIEVDMVAWQVVRFRDGKPVHIRPYRTKEEALEAAELRE